MGATVRNLLAQRRARFWSRLFKRLFALFFASALCIFLWTIGSKINFSVAAKLLNDNNGAVAALATVVLVVITGGYAYATFKLVSVTFKLVNVTLEIRANEVRPLFKISSPKIVKVQKISSHNYTEFHFELELVNFGPSPAINAQLEASVPILDATGKILTYLGTSVTPALPLIINQNQISKCNFALYVEYPDFKVFSREFLELELHYEDVDMNYYHHLESYWLDAVGERWFLNSDYEGLRVLSAKERSFIADTRRAWWYGAPSVIFERTRLPWQSLLRSPSR